MPRVAWRGFAQQGWVASMDVARVRRMAEQGERDLLPAGHVLRVGKGEVVGDVSPVLGDVELAEDGVGVDAVGKAGEGDGSGQAVLVLLVSAEVESVVVGG